MAAAYPSQRRRSALAAENARRAANWGVTYALAFVVLVAVIVGLAAWWSSTGGEVFDNPLAFGFFKP